MTVVEKNDNVNTFTCTCMIYLEHLFINIFFLAAFHLHNLLVINKIKAKINYSRNNQYHHL